MSADRPRFEISKSTLRLGEHRVAHAQGDFDVHFFRDLANETTAMAITVGDPTLGQPLLARVHSSCVTSESLMGRDCDCREQLEGALATMARAGRGVLFYLLQEGRGAGLTAKARDRMMVQASGNRITTFEAYASMGLPADLRRYDLVAPMSRLLGVRAPIRLMTNNPDKAAAVGDVLATEKIELLGTETIQGPTSPFNSDYLHAKRASGHALDPPSRREGAAPPVDVRVFDPVALPGDERRVVTASYFLPVRLPSSSTDLVEWFRMSVVYDRDRERESILLSRGEDEPDLAPVEAVRVGLLDRLPFPRAAGRAALARALEAIRVRGKGAVSVELDERDEASGSVRDGDDTA
ncbi:MAG: GTP cyclohydrolase II [Myxococcota bacterium]